ncbi:hypothetical protein [Embleya sp. NPDC020630]|uniref:hypothetical protein n=1 Tax=Embleya sp. NPDC020630 TaxID=3363979 RepID=UPI00378DCB44
MNAWLIAVAVLLVGGLAPCLVVTSFGSVPRRLVGLTVANTLTVVILLLLAEGLHRTSYPVGCALVVVLGRFLDQTLRVRPADGGAEGR